MTSEAEKLISDLMNSFQEKYNQLGRPVADFNVYMAVLNQEKTFLDEEEARKFCHVGKTIFRQAVNLGLIPFCIFPGSTKKLFHRETLEKVIKSNHRKGLKSERLLA